MNTERLDRINAFLREESDLAKTMSEMDEQCERIRKYCLDAVADVMETAKTVLDIVKNNPCLFPIESGTCANKSKVSTSDRTGYFLVNVNDGMFSDVYTPSPDGDGLTFFGGKIKTLFPTSWMPISRLVEVEKGLKGEKTLKEWVELKGLADNTKKWAEELLRILESHVKARVDALHNVMKDGIRAASAEYTKIGG